MKLQIGPYGLLSSVVLANVLGMVLCSIGTTPRSEITDATISAAIALTEGAQAPQEDLASTPIPENPGLSEEDALGASPQSPKEPSPTPVPNNPPPSGDIAILWDTSHGPRQSSTGEAYAPSGLYSNLESELAGQQVLISENSSPLSAAALSNYEVVVINTTSAEETAYSGTEASILFDYVSAGGGVLVLGEQPEFPNNVGPVAARLGAETGASPRVDQAATFSDHPITDGIGLLDFLDAGTLQVTSADGVARSGGSTVVAVNEIGDGRVVIIGDSNIFDNRKISSGDNLRFAVNVFLWLSKRN